MQTKSTVVDIKVLGAPMQCHKLSVFYNSSMEKQCYPWNMHICYSPSANPTSTPKNDGIQGQDIQIRLAMSKTENMWGLPSKTKSRVHTVAK